MIVREQQDTFVLIEQHEHALISAEFARHWRDKPRPYDSTLYAVENHDIAWRELDANPLWNEKRSKPYSFLDYPPEPKLTAQKRGIDLVEESQPYAACLCSMHYSRFLMGSDKPLEIEFRERELDRQRRLRQEMAAEESENLEHNFDFLRLCDGLSLFVCLNEPGDSDRPPPYPGGFALGKRRFEALWEDERTLRLEPNPFLEPFEVTVPYRVVGRDRREVESNVLRLGVTC